MNCELFVLYKYFSGSIENTLRSWVNDRMLVPVIQMAQTHQQKRRQQARLGKFVGSSDWKILLLHKWMKLHLKSEIEPKYEFLYQRWVKQKFFSNSNSNRFNFSKNIFKNVTFITYILMPVHIILNQHKNFRDVNQFVCIDTSHQKRNILNFDLISWNKSLLSRSFHLCGKAIFPSY